MYTKLDLRNQYLLKTGSSTFKSKKSIIDRQTGKMIKDQMPIGNTKTLTHLS